jgi:hypothetical protein
MVGQYRPLLFFGVTGMMMLIFSLYWGLMVVDIYGRSQQLAVGYALITLMFSILGSLSLFTGIMLHSIRGLILDMERNREGR